MALSRGNTPIHVHAQGVIQREMLKKASILVQDQEKSKTEPRSTFCTYFILFLTLLYNYSINRLSNYIKSV